MRAKTEMAATDQAERRRFRAVFEKRIRQTNLRIGLAVFQAACLAVFMGTAAALLWTATYAALQLVETQVLRRRLDQMFDLVGGAFLVLNSTAYGAITWLTTIHASPFVYAGAAFCITGCILNAVMNTQGSRLAFWCSIIPYVIYSAGLPLFAIKGGASPIDAIPLALGIFMIPLLAYVTARATEAALETAEAALALAEQRRSEAEAATEAKTRFVNLVTRQLSPLMQTIRRDAETLKAEVPETALQTAELIDDSSAMMSELLRDLQDLSRVETGTLALSATRFDLRRVLDQTAAFWRQEAERKGVALILDGEDRIDDTVWGDATRVRQILNNLISNALKFTAAGSVCLRVRQAQDGRFMLAVSDTGEGMTSEQAGRLFTPFVQADDATARKHGGTGLGLSISRDLARAMGGDIVVASAVGQGSEFTVWLDLSGEAPIPAQTPALDRAAA